jgi:predicted HTH transcriptional regulator
MFDTVEELVRQIRLGEDSSLELKDLRYKGDHINEPRRSSMADALAAMANTANGVFVLGVDDKTRQMTRNELLTSMLSRCPVESFKNEARRHYLMERRGEGVPIILTESENLSGRLPEYRLLDDSELLLTIYAAQAGAPIQFDGSDPLVSTQA